MLDLFKQYTIPIGGDQQITAWRDTDEENTFYVMNQQPQFRIASGKPVFNFFKYKTAVTAAGSSKMGGYATFDLEFKVDNQMLIEARKWLEGQKLVKDPSQFRWGSIPYADGTASITVPFQETSNTPHVTLASPGKPSLVGDNVATFAMQIPSDVSLIFERLLNPDPKKPSPSASITAVYTLKFAAKLPPITCKVTLKREDAIKLAEESKRTWNTWNTGYDRSEERNLTQTVKEEDAIEINWGPIDQSSLSPTDKEKLKTSIRQWGWDTYKEMLESKLAPLKPPDPTKTDETTFKKTVEESIKQDEVREFNESQAITYTVLPQGSLPSIRRVLELLKTGEDPNNYFQELDADDPFFDQMRRSVLPQLAFDDLELRNVQVEIRYPKLRDPKVCSFDAPAKPATGTATSAEVQKCDWASNYADKDGKHVQEYEYRVRVTYAKSTVQPYQSDFKTTDAPILQLTPTDVGILPINVYTGNIDWKNMTGVDVTVKYQNTTLPTVTLTKDKPTANIRRVIGAYEKKPFEYTLVYRTKGGTITKMGQQEGLQYFDIYVNDPITDQDEYRFNPPQNYNLGQIQTLTLDVVYECEDPEKGLVQSVRSTLTGKPPFKWTVPVITAKSGVVTYSGQVDFTNGSVGTIPKSEHIEGTIVTLQKLPTMERAREAFQVDVDPGNLDWTKWKEVKVVLQYGTQPDKNITFNKDSGTETWEITPEDGTAYKWKADYIPVKGRRVQTGWKDADTNKDNYLDLQETAPAS